MKLERYKWKKKHMYSIILLIFLKTTSYIINTHALCIYRKKIWQKECLPGTGGENGEQGNQPFCIVLYDI
jgi:hypothetical protein